MIKPKGLKFGDKIGVVSPASPTSKENVEKANKQLRNMGFKVEIGDCCYEQYGYLSGSDKLRAEELNNMFNDKTIDGIICMRGGYGTSRILELIDYEIIKNNPKVFVGYSDITALHIAIGKYSNLVTFHGPMVASNIINNFDDFSKRSLYNSILEGEFVGNLMNPPEKEIFTINEGIVEGEIIGGNLCLIADTLGTPYEIDTKGKILFIEEVGEEPYRIDRLFTQLKLAGKLEDAKGIILGDFDNCEAKTSEYIDSLSLKQVIDDIIKPLGKPTIYNFQSGHCKPIVTIPFGVKVRLDATNRRLNMLEKPTK